MRSQDILIKYAELNPLRYRDSVSKKTWEKILSRTLFYFTKIWICHKLRQFSFPRLIEEKFKSSIFIFTNKAEQGHHFVTHFFDKLKFSSPFIFST